MRVSRWFSATMTVVVGLAVQPQVAARRPQPPAPTTPPRLSDSTSSAAPQLAAALDAPPANRLNLPPRLATPHTARNPRAVRPAPIRVLSPGEESTLDANPPAPATRSDDANGHSDDRPTYDSSLPVPELNLPGVPLNSPGPPPPAAADRRKTPIDTGSPLATLVTFATPALATGDPPSAGRLVAAFSSNHGERQLTGEALTSRFALAGDERLPVESDGDAPALALRIKAAGFAWWTVELPADKGPVDLKSALADGYLELTLRGEQGGERFRCGVTDGAERMALVDATTFGDVGAVRGVVRIPLKALRTANKQLDWGAVRGVMLASAHGEPLRLWICSVRVGRLAAVQGEK